MPMWKKFALNLKKRLSQHFLIDQKAIESIAGSIPLEGKTVLEIGAGSGNLTRSLSKYAEKVVAVEKDINLIPILKRNLRYHKNVVILHADALEMDLSKYRTTVGSIPYRIASKLLF